MLRYLNTTEKRNEQSSSQSVTVDLLVDSQVNGGRTIPEAPSLMASTSATSQQHAIDKPEHNNNPWPYLNEYFRFLGCKNGSKSVEFECLLCKPKLKNISANITTLQNLKKHVRAIHHTSNNDFLRCIEKNARRGIKRKQPESDSSAVEPQKEKGCVQMTMKQSIQRPKVDKELYENKVINVFVENMLPLDIVESDSFEDFVKSCVPGSSSISRRTLTRWIEDRHLESKTRLKEILKDINWLATTADVWTCRGRSYLGMTVHWIDETTLQRRKAVLACKRLRGPHTYDILAKEMDNTYWEFQIENKVTKTTTDNGSNFIKVFNVFGVVSSDDGEEQDAEMEVAQDVQDDAVQVNELTAVLEAGSGDAGFILPKHMRCAAHTLNLVASVDAEKALARCGVYRKMYRSAFAKAQQLWNKQSRSSKVADAIKDNVGVLLVVPTVTRWNSVYDSVGRLVHIFEDRERCNGLNRACTSNLGLTTFTNGDMTFLKEYHTVMRPVCQALDVLHAEEKAYLGVLLPTLAMTLKRLTDIKTNNSIAVCLPLVDVLVEAIQTRFGHWFKDRDFQLATAFHPQFRLSCFQWLTSDAAELKTKIKQNMLHAIQEENCSAEEDGGRATEDFFAPLYAKARKREQSALNLLQEYLEANPEHKLSGSRFTSSPMKKLFLKHNTPIPSSAAVERLFSLGKDILKPKRAGLSDEHFEMLVFLKGNKNIFS